MTPPAPRVEEAFRYCRQVARSRARNFYYGLKLAPEPQRSALFTVYAWMRRADDLVDAAAGDGAAARRGVEAFRSATDAALAGRPDAGDPLWEALARTAADFPVDRSALHAMLEGQLEDLARPRYETFEEVREYCYRVASSVGLVCIGIWGCRDGAARALAVDRGIAFQLTNILRDFREDYDAGRVYLPEEDFRRHGLTAPALRRWSDTARCRAFVLEQVERAEEFYRRSADLERTLDGSALPTLWAMTTIYSRLLEKIRRDPWRIVAARRLRLSSLQKGLIALRARRLAAGKPAAAPA